MRMVKKYACVLLGQASPLQAQAQVSDPTDAALCTRLIAENDELHSALCACKNVITRYTHGHRWDTYKRWVNGYELVHPTAPSGGSKDLPGVASHNPISRSFFKMWELLQDYGAEMVPACVRCNPVRAAFLAEGPGGFVEAFMHWRLSVGAAAEGASAQDELHGMTLLPQRSRNVPGWRLQAARGAHEGADGHAAALQAQAQALHVHRGADGTGDLYQLANLDALVGAVGASSCHLVTADGGFDFSCDYNGQEGASLRLLVCEVYAALRLQRAGGAFVLKVYDIRALATLRLVHALRCAYGRVRIVKPHTSRPANSEKYIVCTDFQGASERLVCALRAACAADGAPQAVADLLRAVQPMPAAFVRDVLAFNTVHIARLAACIARTILLIQQAQQPPDGVLSTQLNKAVRWCHKYGIHIAPAALKAYRPLLAASSESYC